MRKMESYTYMRWKKMWRLWKHHKLDSPLEELVTYDNYMAHGHLCYFEHLKDNSLIERHMLVLKEYIPESFYNNLNKAYMIYKDIQLKSEYKEFTDFDLEEIFMEVDEWYYEDSYEILKIIMTELQGYHKIKIHDFFERQKVIRKVKLRKNNPPSFG